MKNVYDLYETRICVKHFRNNKTYMPQYRDKVISLPFWHNMAVKANGTLEDAELVVESFFDNVAIKEEFIYPNKTEEKVL